MLSVVMLLLPSFSPSSTPAYRPIPNEYFSWFLTLIGGSWSLSLRLNIDKLFTSVDKPVGKFSCFSSVKATI